MNSRCAAKEDDVAEPNPKRARLGSDGSVSDRQAEVTANDPKPVNLDALSAAVKVVLAPPDDPAFARQSDYLYCLLRKSTDDKLEAILTSWESLTSAISNFLSYWMVRKVWGETWDGNRMAAMACHNLVVHLRNTGMINDMTQGTVGGAKYDADRLLGYTSALADFPYEGASEMQKLYETCYWEKKEEAYPHLRESKFLLEPGDSYTKTIKDKATGENKEVQVEIKESDMIMTKGDINKMSDPGAWIAMARVLGVFVRNLGCRISRPEMIRGEETTIYCGPRGKGKEYAHHSLDEYRKGGYGGRSYLKIKVDEFGGRIKITKVGKSGWWMGPESWGGSVFIPLTAKMAKMGVEGSVFSGMRLALAGGVWRPIPAEEGDCVCYNIYPPDFYDYTDK